MDIREIEHMLGLTKFLPLPTNIIITKEPVKRRVNGEVHYRGLQPVQRKDTIILTPDMDITTVFHETLHCMGFGEHVAYPGGRILATLYQIRKNLPQIFERKVRYEKCTGGCDYPELHSHYGGRAEHYVLRGV